LHLLGFLTTAVLEGASLTPSHRLMDQAAIFLSTADMVVKPYAGHWVFISVASSDKRGLRWGYSCSPSQHGKIINDNIEFYPQNYDHCLIRLTCNIQRFNISQLKRFSGTRRD
jgi:hypothetical protein